MYVTLKSTILAIILLNASVRYCYGNQCFCPSEYYGITEDEKLHCKNFNIGRIVPCIAQPHCKCLGDAIKVAWGKNAEFCAGNYNRRIRIWPCENEEDWKDFWNKLKEKV